MKVTYRGARKEQPQKLQEKLDAKFGKLSKLLETRGEKEAHVILTSERHLQHAEITLQFYDHQLVGIGSDRDQFTAIYTALETMEKQAVKHRGKWREKARRKKAEPEARSKPVKAKASPASQAARSERDRNENANGHKGPAKHVFRVNQVNHHKPMTLDEAMIEMEGGSEYMVYHDADREGISVLVRRKDGNFDLIEN
jgi:putative sigma-54 modulation protein